MISDFKIDKKLVENFFVYHNLGEAKLIEKIEIGFSNVIYSINNEYILKICKDLDNEQRFKHEVFLYNYFKSIILVPEVLVFDSSKKILNRICMVYPKIAGDNLYSKWHLFSDDERKSVVRQICNILKIIVAAPVEDFLREFKLDRNFNWHDNIIEKINESLKKITKGKLLPSDFIQAIKEFVSNNREVLREQKIALVYWDIHFDNVIVRDGKVVGILDFERTELASIDFILDIVKRMMDYPSKYMSKASEKFAKKEDYARLIEWFREFYPELFNFNDLGRRLDLYSVEHDLATLLWWPDSKEVKQAIANTIKYEI